MSSPPHSLLLLLPPPPPSSSSLTVLSASPAHRNFPYEHRFRRISRETPVTIVLTPASNVSRLPFLRGPNVVDGAPRFCSRKPRIWYPWRANRREIQKRRIERVEGEGERIGSFLLNERTNEEGGRKRSSVGSVRRFEDVNVPLPPSFPPGIPAASLFRISIPTHHHHDEPPRGGGLSANWHSSFGRLGLNAEKRGRFDVRRPSLNERRQPGPVTSGTE